MSLLSQGNWFDADAGNLRNQINEFGEWFTHTPYSAKPNFPSEPDPTRAGATLQMVYERDAKRLMLGMEEAGVSTRSPEVTAMVCDFLSPVRQKDRFTHCLTGEVFEVTDPKPDGLAGITICMVQLGRRT